jgi:hypothetical protein
MLMPLVKKFDFNGRALSDFAASLMPNIDPSKKSIIIPSL